MKGHLSILLFLLLLVGCADQGSTPVPAQSTPPRPEGHGGVEPGVVDVLFIEGTTTEAAEQFVRDLKLTFKSAPSGPLLFAVVRVPVDTEDQWVEKLLSYPIVRSAGRIVVASTP
jgi:hypothetical protein